MCRLLLLKLAHLKRTNTIVNIKKDLLIAQTTVAAAVVEAQQQAGLVEVLPEDNPG